MSFYCVLSIGLALLISPLPVCPAWCRFQVSRSRFQTAEDRKETSEEVQGAIQVHYHHISLFWLQPDCRLDYVKDYISKQILPAAAAGSVVSPVAVSI